MAPCRSLLISVFNVAVVTALAVHKPYPVRGTHQLSYRNASNGVLAVSGTPTTPTSFQDVTCGYKTVGSAVAPGPQRWSDAMASEAFGYFNNAWNNELAGQGASYVVELSSFWHGPESWDCGVQINHCDAGVPNCGDKDTTGPNGHQIANPAAWLIMNSFSNIHNFYFNQYLSFINAGPQISSSIHSFATTFSPIPPSDTDFFKLLLDGITLGYAQLAAFSWNTFLKELDAFGKDGILNHGWSKDGVNAIVTGMLGLGKDLLPAAKSAIAAEQTLEAMVGQLIASYESTTASFLEHIFSGSAEYLPLLATMIDNGKWIDNTFEMNTFLDIDATTQLVERVLYAQLMPAAWNQVGGLHPVIVMDDTICTSSPKVGGTSAARYIGQDMQNAVGICYNNIGFYLLSVNDDTHFGPRERPPTNGGHGDYRRDVPSSDSDSLQPRRLIDPDLGDPDIFDLLPGATKSNLDGNNWAKIVIEDIVISSYGGWVMNGNQNGYTVPLDTMAVDQSGAQGDTLFPSDIRTPGVFSIPLCTIDQALENWRTHQFDGSKPQYYPCNS